MDGPQVKTDSASDNSTIDPLEAGRECLAAALRYLALGWSPLHVCPPDHDEMRGAAHSWHCGKDAKVPCTSPGKRPIGAWLAFQRKAAAEETVRSWWRTNPTANVGIALGGPASGMIAVDTDNAMAEEAIRRLAGGEPAPTWEFHTGKGYRRLYGVARDNEYSTSHFGAKLGNGLSLLGLGAQTVMPPSRHPSGGRYRWAEGRSPDDIAIEPAPVWLLDEMNGGARRNGTHGQRAEPLEDGEVIRESEPGRDVVLTSMAGSMRRRGFQVNEILAALREVNRRCEPPLPDATLEKIAASVGRYAPSDPALRMVVEKGEVAAEVGGWRWRPIDSRALANDTPKPEWLVSRTLVSGMPLVIGGPQKALKTSIAVDLCVSLATGTPFLGKFAVPTQRRVAVISGESGRWALMEAASRVCRSKQVKLEDVDVRWQFNLPRLNEPAHLDELRDGIEKDGIEFVVIDPLYLALLPGEKDATASNLFATGPLLLGVASACIEAGATPALCHHATKPAARTNEPLELPDLAFSGIAEFARQWLLLNRRAKYAPGEPNQLWVSAGGSCGQGGLWAVDVDEGTLREDFTGRFWDVAVNDAASHREAVKKEKEQEDGRATARTMERHEADMLAAIDILDPAREGVKLQSVIDALGTSGGAARDTARRLATQRRVEIIKALEYEKDNGRTGTATGIRRVGP